MGKMRGTENIRPRAFFLMMLMFALCLARGHQEASTEVCSQYPSPSLGLVVLGLLVLLGLLVVVVYGVRRWRMATGNRIVSQYIIEEPPITVTNGGKTMTYFHGSLRYENERNLRPASFIEVPDLDQAHRIMEIGGRLKHEGVLKPISIIQPIGRTLIAVESFQFVCANWDDITRNMFRRPSRNRLIPGNPRESVQDEIRNLTSSLLYVHSKGFSSSGLSSSCSYFWTGESFKILPDMVDDGASWGVTKEAHISELGDFIRRIFLNVNNAWIERDHFMECFNTQKQMRDPADRLLMIRDHPFLCKNLKKILEIFPDLDHAIESKEYNERHGISYLAFLLRDPNNTCLDQGCFRDANDPWATTWYDSNMHTYFDQIMKHGITPVPPRPLTPPRRPIHKGRKVYSYKVRDCRHLIRFCRNIFAHCYGSKKVPPPNPVPPKFPLKFMYIEINRSWPRLIYLLHELSY